MRDTPIAETGFVGAALGLAITGYRPIVEIMFADFLGVCFDQIVNEIAKHRFMSGGKVKAPLVIRAIGGGGLRFGAQHSQTANRGSCRSPASRSSARRRPAEAYGMLSAAIRDDNPVVVLEHKALLSTQGPGGGRQRRMAARSPGRGAPPRPRRHGGGEPRHGGARARGGGAARGRGHRGRGHRHPRAATDDRPPIVDSVRRTNILVTVEEQAQVGGWGAEVVAQVTSEAFDYLDAPPGRVTLPDYPVPYSPPLEDAAIPSPERIAAAVKALV